MTILPDMQVHLITQEDPQDSTKKCLSKHMKLLTPGEEDDARPSGGYKSTTSREEDTAHPTGGYMTTQ